MKNDIKCVLDVMSGYGEDLSVYEKSFLENALEKRRERTGARGLDAYCRLLEESRPEGEALMDALRITYSCFFREPCSFILIEKLLPGMMDRKRDGSEVRIWSAGCAGGQEAYSIAMLMEDAAEESGGTRYRIFATDCSEKALKTAERGAYSLEALGNVRAGRLWKYFREDGEGYRVEPRLKKSISFSVYDLLDGKSSYPADSIFGGFDIVFCRNVLLYYRAELRSLIMGKLVKSITDGGYLVVGEAERPFAAKTQGLSAYFPAGAVFVKQEKGMKARPV